MANQVDWYTEKVTAIFEKASMDVLSELAFLGEGYAKANITENDQVDTGFLRASVYAVVPGKSDYTDNQAEADGKVAEKGRPERSHAESVQLPDDRTVAIAVAAEYAIYQEMKQPFLYKALESLAQEFQGVVERHKET